MKNFTVPAFLFTVAVCALSSKVHGDEIDAKYPLADQLRVLEQDAKSEKYRKLVEQMNGPDLDAEWRRYDTLDNPESFLEKHGGEAKVLADRDLKKAYQRRVEIREAYMNLMRAEFKKRGQTAPFDKGLKAERAGTTTKLLGGAGVELSYVLPSPGAEKHWPRFRGPTGQGNTFEKRLPVTWSTTKNIVWKTELPGDGNSSPVIWGDRLFFTSSGPEGLKRAVHCLRVSDGQLLWTTPLAEQKVEPNVRPKNGFASSTPVVDGERVIAYFGAGGLVCLDLEGKPMWHYPTPDFASTHGSGASPLLYNDLVILIHDQNKSASICVALNKKTGDVVWQRERAKAMGWATPVVVRVKDHDELLFAGGRTFKAYDPATGEELWTLDGPTEEVVPAAVIGPNLVYSASGRQGPTLGVRPGGKGNVAESHLAWRTVRGGPHVPTPVHLNGRLYVVNDFGIASCLNAETGENIWQARIQDKFSASGIEAGGLLYFCSETGITYVLRAADKFEIVAENDLGEPILASPAALGGKLYIRAGKTMYCVGEF
jgi:outer membrane protein assembly factor BamB